MSFWGHARNNSADVFVLVSGDDDLTEAVEEAQAHGVQVILLAVPNAAGNRMVSAGTWSVPSTNYRRWPQRALTRP